MEDSTLSFTSNIIGVLTFAVAIFVWLGQHLHEASKMDDELAEITVLVLRSAREAVDLTTLCATTGLRHTNTEEFLVKLYTLVLQSLVSLLEAPWRSRFRRILTWGEERTQLRQNLSAMKELRSKIIDILLFEISMRISGTQGELKSNFERLQWTLRGGSHKSAQGPDPETPQMPEQEAVPEPVPEQASEFTSLQGSKGELPQLPAQQYLLHERFKILSETAGIYGHGQNQIRTLPEQFSSYEAIVTDVTKRLQEQVQEFLATGRIRPSPSALAIAVFAFYILEQLGTAPLQLWQLVVRLWSQLSNSRDTTANRKDTVQDVDAVALSQ